jgi:hypothetical protein
LKGDGEGETPKNFMFVDAKEDEHGVPSAKGSMSLLVFGLNRKVLQEERHKEYIALTLMMNDAAFFIDMLNEDGDSMSEERRLNLQGRISNLLTELHVRRRNDQRFSAMTRFFVDDFLSKYGLTE